MAAIGLFTELLAEGGGGWGELYGTSKYNINHGQEIPVISRNSVTNL